MYVGLHILCKGNSEGFFGVFTSFLFICKSYWALTPLNFGFIIFALRITSSFRVSCGCFQVFRTPPDGDARRL